jgi:hypothetical protein
MKNSEPELTQLLLRTLEALVRDHEQQQRQQQQFFAQQQQQWEQQAGDLDRAGAGLAAAVADVVGVIAAVDRAVGFCRCPLQFLAQILIHEIRQRRISPHPVHPQPPQHKLPLPSL